MKCFTQLFVVSACLLLSGCGNPFLQNYKGKTFPHVSSATRVMETPDTNTVDLIGQSTFLTAQKVNEQGAIAAANSVGADLVEWDRSYKGTTTRLEIQPIFGPYTGGVDWAQGGSQVDVERPMTEKWYRYHARFYRSK